MLEKGIFKLSFQLLSLFNEPSNFFIIDTHGASDSLRNLFNKPSNFFIIDTHGASDSLFLKA